jgi:hypothetical protein
MSNSRYKTHRGREFNMSAFAEKNGDTRAVGNSSMNARGDIIDARGNVKIPTQTISRALSDVKNKESKTVSLKADETIAPVKNKTVAPDTTVKSTAPVEIEEVGPQIVSQREIETEDGPAIEIEYDDGSMEVKLIDE